MNRKSIWTRKGRTKYTKYSTENTKVENHEILTRIIPLWNAKCLKEETRYISRWYLQSEGCWGLFTSSHQFTILYIAGLRKWSVQCKEYQQLEEKFEFLTIYEETETPRDMADQVMSFFSKLNLLFRFCKQLFTFIFIQWNESNLSQLFLWTE